jgi:hypothetical protein
MTDVARRQLWSRLALAVAGAGTLFWLYTFYAIAQVPAGDGTGFQWIAVIPLGFVFLVLTLPALILALVGRTPFISLAFGVPGLAAFAWLWSQLLGEFYH